MKKQEPYNFKRRGVNINWSIEKDMSWGTALVIVSLIFIISYFGTKFFIAIREDTRRADVIRMAESMGMRVVADDGSCINCNCQETQNGTEPVSKQPISDH